MNPQDAYFTHTIVGAPFSVLMGRRAEPGAAEGSGIEVGATGEAQLSPAWQAWAIQRAEDWPAGVPRRRPRGLRRWLERHALGIALLGLLALLAGAALAAGASGLLPEGWWPWP